VKLPLQCRISGLCRSGEESYASGGIVEPEMRCNKSNQVSSAVWVVVCGHRACSTTTIDEARWISHTRMKRLGPIKYKRHLTPPSRPRPVRKEQSSYELKSNRCSKSVGPALGQNNWKKTCRPYAISKGADLCSKESVKEELHLTAPQRDRSVGRLKVKNQVQVQPSGRRLSSKLHIP
jgi:hypothetical protein